MKANGSLALPRQSHPLNESCRWSPGILCHHCNQNGFLLCPARALPLIKACAGMCGPAYPLALCSDVSGTGLRELRVGG